MALLRGRPHLKHLCQVVQGDVDSDGLVMQLLKPSADYNDSWSGTLKPSTEPIYIEPSTGGGAATRAIIAAYIYDARKSLTASPVLPPASAAARSNVRYFCTRCKLTVATFVMPRPGTLYEKGLCSSVQFQRRRTGKSSTVSTQTVPALFTRMCKHFSRRCSMSAGFCKSACAGVQDPGRSTVNST